METNEICECSVDWQYMAYRAIYFSKMTTEQISDLHEREKKRGPIMDGEKRLDEGQILPLFNIGSLYFIQRLGFDDSFIDSAIITIKGYVPRDIKRQMSWGDSVNFVHAWDENIKVHCVEFTTPKNSKNSNFDN